MAATRNIHPIVIKICRSHFFAKKLTGARFQVDRIINKGTSRAKVSILGRKIWKNRKFCTGGTLVYDPIVMKICKSHFFAKKLTGANFQVDRIINKGTSRTKFAIFGLKKQMLVREVPEILVRSCWLTNLIYSGL